MTSSFPPAADRLDSSRTIAVLPFVNLSADAESEFFADGVADEITGALSRLRSLRVISRRSSARFKGATKEVRTTATELGTRFLLEGSVRRAGHHLRVTAQLIDADLDAHLLWAETFDGTVDDVFAIQERIARAIIGALKVPLSLADEKRLAERPIEDLHAYECYLRARQQIWSGGKRAIEQAIHLLRSGLAAAGDNGRLYATLGVAYLALHEGGSDLDARHRAEAESCARRVFELDPGSAAGLRLRGWIHCSRGEIKEAVRDLTSALRLEPNDADVLMSLSNCYLVSGRVETARPLIERLVRIDPLTPSTRCMPARAAMAEGDFAAAAGPYRQRFETDPTNAMARLFYALVLLYTGQPADSRRLVDGFAPDARDTLPARVGLLLVMANEEGRDGGALPSLTPAMEAAARASDALSRMLADAYACAGLADEAMKWLELSVERGYINYPFLAELDPLLARIRGDARFMRLMTVVRARWEEFDG